MPDLPLDSREWLRDCLGLDAEVAEVVMGWRLEELSDGGARNWYWVSAAGERERGATGGRFDPSRDPRDTRQVEDEIERRGLALNYLQALCVECGVWAGLDHTSLDLWTLLRATPEQRCRAAVRAVKGAADASRSL